MQVKVLGRKCDVYILIACVVLGVFVGVNLLCNCPSCGIGGAEGFAGLEGAGLDPEENDASASLTPPEDEPAAKDADGNGFSLEGMTAGQKKGEKGVASKAAPCTGECCPAADESQ